MVDFSFIVSLYVSDLLNVTSIVQYKGTGTVVATVLYSTSRTIQQAPAGTVPYSYSTVGVGL